MLRFFKSLWGESRPKLIQSFGLFAGYFFSQVGTQVINMVAGFLIIRAMTKDDYANYTIINTLGPVMLMLSDNGIATGLSAIGRHLRRKFALVSFILIGPLLAWMLFRNHTPLSIILLLTAATVTGVSFQLTGAVMAVILQLRQQIKTLAKVSLASSFTRLCLVAGFVVVFHLDAFLATLAGTFSVMLETFFLVRAVKPQVLWDAPPDLEYRTTIYSLVKKTMPLTIYFCVQGQISIWLISIFGSAHQVADIGAAGRLGIIFTTLSASYGAIALPRFARNNGRRLLFVQFFQITGSMILLLLGFVAFTKLFPGPFVMLLGPQYTNMSGLIWLVVLSSGLNSLGGTVFGLNTSKGWIPPAILTIPVEITTQIVLLLTLNLSKTENVLIFSFLATIPPTLVNTAILLRRIRLEAE